MRAQNIVNLLATRAEQVGTGKEENKSDLRKKDATWVSKLELQAKRQRKREKSSGFRREKRMSGCSGCCRNSLRSQSSDAHCYQMVDSLRLLQIDLCICILNIFIFLFLKLSKIIIHHFNYNMLKNGMLYCVLFSFCILTCFDRQNKWCLQRKTIQHSIKTNLFYFVAHLSPHLPILKIRRKKRVTNQCVTEYSTLVVPIS